MTAAYTVANADAIAEISMFITKECDHITPAITGSIYRQWNITFGTKQIDDLSFRDLYVDGIF
jgi:hypothetical protein